MQDLLTFLAAHVDEWDSSTEEVARRDFRSETHAKEMRGIDAWKRRFPNSTYEWPLARRAERPRGSLVR